MSFPWAKEYKPSHPFMQWMDEKLPLPRLVYNAVGSGYPVPRNLNYWWNFGFLALICLALQIVTGIVLAMHYASNAAMAFDSTEHIMRDVNWGWLMRYAHANGASAFFVVIYIHIFRGFFYGSYKAPREMVWLLGVVIFLLMMATAFMGYVLPWGQMSFWGAKVITGLFGAIPLVGEPLQQWLLGGFAPDNAALNRFFSLHYLLPFVIVGVVVLHIWALHIPGSSNPTGVEVKTESDTVPFYPYFIAKDGWAVGAFLFLYCAVLFFAPNLLAHPDNYIPANPMSTPAHIVPEWYFWPFYAILRAFTFDFLFIPAKLLGVMAMFGSILIWFFQVLLCAAGRDGGAVLLRRCPGGGTLSDLCPARIDLLLRPLPHHPADRLLDRAARSAALLDHRGSAGQRWPGGTQPPGQGLNSSETESRKP
jgi:ubiquinol-cytochrome c reductase cytochrome b subunit